MTLDEARRLLDRVSVLRNPCDLDLLLFFARHPRVLLTSESLARFLGYDLKVLARSLEVLLQAGILARSQTAAHAGRLYMFTSPTDERMSSVLQTASSPDGRRILRAALHRMHDQERGDRTREADIAADGGQGGRGGRFPWKSVRSDEARRVNGDVTRTGEHDD